MCAAREQFKYLLVGMLAEIKRKTLPAIAKAVGAEAQGLHHFVANAPWSVQELRAKRLALVRQALAGRPFILCMDETGDRKKGHTTDYVSHQYIGNLGKLENGMVSVNAYGILDQITFPLLFKVFKPRTRLKPGDSYKTKPELAVEIIQEVQQWGFRFSVVLADSLYGERSEFVGALENLHLRYVVAIRSNHGVWLPKGQRVRYTNWRPFERVFSNGKQQPRYIREIVFGQRGRIRYSHLTTDPKTLPPESTWYLMTKLEGKIRKTIGNTYGLRPWIEYGFKHAKNELRHPLKPRKCPLPLSAGPSHRWWDSGQGWKNILNNLRLILQPYVFHCLLLPWLLLFDIPGLRAGFLELIGSMNLFHAALPT
jgi:SRSO17 transposase